MAVRTLRSTWVAVVAAASVVVGSVTSAAAAEPEPTPSISVEATPTPSASPMPTETSQTESAPSGVALTEPEPSESAPIESAAPTAGPTAPSDAAPTAPTQPTERAGLLATLLDVPVPDAQAVVPAGATISGKVTLPAGFVTSSITVAASPAAGGTAIVGLLDADGRYVIDGVPPGTYIVSFDGYPSLWSGYYPNLVGSQHAQRIIVTAGGAVTGIDVTYEEPGTITGVLSGPSGPIAHGYVSVSATDAGAGGSASTDADGRYTVSNLRPAAYQVYFSAAILERVVNLYHGGAARQEDAVAVTVAPGATVSLADVLPRSASVSGRVLGPDGAPVAGASVGIRSSTESVWSGAVTDADGRYTFDDGLGAGSYLIRFHAMGAHLASEYYDDSSRLDQATPVTLGTAAVRSGVDARLDRAATIHASLTDSEGAPAHTYVSLHDPATGAFLAAPAWTDGGGGAQLDGLRAGSYALGFARASGDTPYVAQYYRAPSGTTTNLRDASTVTPAVDVATTVTASLRTGAQITGAVRNANGTPEVGRLVVAFVDDGVRVSRSTFTGEDGSYTIRGLLPGAYYVAVVTGIGGDPADVFHGTGVKPASPNVTVVGTATTGGVDVTVGTMFADVQPGASFAADIEWLAAQGITQGSVLADGWRVFDSVGPVRREAMAAFLYRAAGSPEFTAPTISPFTDVATTAPFYKEISWLAARNISAGTDVGGGKKEFRPAEPVTREAMAAFLYRFKGSPAFTVPGTAPFQDVLSGAPFAKEIAWLASVGVSTGTDVGGGKKEFRPKESVRREAMAAFLHRAAGVAGAVG